MSSNNKTKLVQVIADSSISGGPRHVLGLISNIDKEKFDVLLIAPRGWLTAEATKIKGVKIKIVDFKSKWDLSSLAKLKRDIAQFRSKNNPFGPIIVHAHGPRAGSFCRWTIRQGEKFVYTEHIWNLEYHIGNPINRQLQLAGLRRVTGKADLIIAVSKSVKEFIVDKLRVPAEKVVVIPNAIEISGHESHKSHPEKLLVGTIGTLVPTKGQIYLIRAFEKVSAGLPKARLEIIGDGPEKEKLLAEIKRLGLESKIQLLGRQEKLEKFFKNWDLFVLPSLSETFGLVILEAFEAKVPVIASNIGGIPELIHNEKTGYLVPPADPEKLAKAISYLLVEKKERESLADEAYELLKKRYDWSKIIDEIEQRYQTIIN